MTPIIAQRCRYRLCFLLYKLSRKTYNSNSKASKRGDCVKERGAEEKGPFVPTSSRARANPAQLDQLLMCCDTLFAMPSFD